MIIIAGITIRLAISNAILQQAINAKDKYTNSVDKENESLEEIYSKLLIADSDGSSLENVDMKTLKSLIQHQEHSIQSYLR